MESLKCTELDRLNDNNTTVEICLLISYIEDCLLYTSDAADD